MPVCGKPFAASTAWLAALFENRHVHVAAPLIKLAFDCRGQRWDIECDPARAPHTFAALARCLPLDLHLHTPKIAGSHIYWHAPFIEEPEGAIDVLQAAPGAFIYWPERQFLEITFAPLQAETASITVLGHIDGGLEPLVELGRALRDGHGREPFAGRLTLVRGQALPPEPAAPVAGPLATLQARRVSLWAACPADVGTLLASRAIMHPAGPLFLAESEARILHETLWWVRTRISSETEEKLRFAGALACNKAATRLRNFCHFGASADLLFDIEQLFRKPELPLAALIDEAIRVAGRLAGWLDLAIPWSDVNAAVRTALDGQRPA